MPNQPTELTPDQALCQQLAEACWKTAASENPKIAWYRSPVYKHAGQALQACVQVTYGVSPLIAERVRCLLSEYGPDDALQGTSGRGIFSYVQFARSNSDRQYGYNR